jgi:hypothetical protein
MGQHRHEDPGTATLAPWCMVRPGGRPVPAFLACGQRSDDLRGQAPERSEGAGPRLVNRSLNARRDVQTSTTPRDSADRRRRVVGRRPPGGDDGVCALSPGCGPVRLLTVGVGRPPQRDPAAKHLPCPEVHLAETSAPAPPPGWGDVRARRYLLPTRTVRPATRSPPGPSTGTTAASAPSLPRRTRVGHPMYDSGSALTRATTQQKETPPPGSRLPDHPQGTRPRRRHAGPQSIPDVGAGHPLHLGGQLRPRRQPPRRPTSLRPRHGSPPRSGQRPDDLRGRSEGACPRLVHLSLNARRDVGGSSHPATARNGAAASSADVHRAETTESCTISGVRTGSGC